MNNGTWEAIRHGQAKLELREPLDWVHLGRRLRATQRLHTVLSEPITLFVGVSPTRLSTPTFLLRDGDPSPNNAFRLDVRQTHWNRRTDLKRWDKQSHLHVWRDDVKDAHAENPYSPPWPDDFDDAAQVGSPEEFELLFQLFCQMVHVKWGPDYHWVDPFAQETIPEEPTTVDGDTIP